MWICGKGEIPNAIEFDLKKVCELGSIAVWNYNREIYTDFGVASMDVCVWTDEKGWKKVLNGAELYEGQGSDDYDDPTVLRLKKPVLARRVRFENLKAFNQKADQLGLSKVRFYEPVGPEAFNPVPGDGGEVKAVDKVQLRWTKGIDAVAHDFYVGESAKSLELLGRIKDEPRAFVSGVDIGKQYYWRVDEVTEKGDVSRGDVWSFKVIGKQVGCWKLDESLGDVAGDSFGGFDGRVAGSAKWCVDGGKVGGCIEFDGEDDYVEVPAFKLNTSCMTMGCWVWAGQQKDDIAGIVFSRAAHTVAGMIIDKADNLLRYHWNDHKDSWGWETGLYVPGEKWVYIAMVVDPSKVVMYLYDDGELKSAENIRQHNIEEFDGVLCFGRDAIRSNDRYFKGMIDDVQIFDYALSKSQIESLCRGQAVVRGEGGSQLSLVDVELVEEGESLEEIANEQNQEDGAVRSNNLIAVIVIICFVLAIALIGKLKKKK